MHGNVYYGKRESDVPYESKPDVRLSRFGNRNTRCQQLVQSPEDRTLMFVLL
jgi:hypothetical protein